GEGQVSDAGVFPRLAGLDPAYLAKQIDDFRQGSRVSEIMRPIAETLTPDETKDVAAYYGSSGCAARADASRRQHVELRPPAGKGRPIRATLKLHSKERASAQTQTDASGEGAISKVEPARLGRYRISSLVRTPADPLRISSRPRRLALL